jgi:SAM-dependent methyltransferase
LTTELADQLGADRVAAADPTPDFLRACSERIPGADVRAAPAEQLPWPDSEFDTVMAQLVLSFVWPADIAVNEMRRVAVPGGTVAACTWDYGDGMQMLRMYWEAALKLDPAAPDEARTLAYTSRESLRELWQACGLSDIETRALVVEVSYRGFDDYWQPFLTGTGPGGQYCLSLEEHDRDALRAECFRALGAPQEAFTLTARSWAVRGRAPVG